MKLRRGLSLFGVFALATGAMVSSGIFILPGLAYARAGPAVIVSYAIAGLLAACGMLSLAELATAMPRAGGDYFFVARGLGPAVGTISGLLSWFSLSLKSAFALAGMGAFTLLAFGIDALWVALFFCVVFLALNLLGVQLASKVQVGLVVGLLVLMVLYVVRGAPAMRMGLLEPVMPHGGAAVFATAGLVFVSFGGLLKVASVAEEIERPERNIPLGMILSLLTVGAAYTLVVLVTTAVLSPEQLAGSLTPLSDGARAFAGRWGAVAMGVAAVLAFVSTANAGMMAASRYLLALGRDRVLPGAFGQVNRRFRTPHVAVLVTGAFMAAALLLRLEVLVKAASTVLILSYMLSIVSVIIMRESRLQNYRPKFRAPLYPWLQIAGVLGFGWLLFAMGATALLISAGLVVAGFLIYWFFGRSRASRDYALLHIVERLTARELVTRSLESELKDIIQERDEIIKDRFDVLVEECVVLDLAECLRFEGLFHRIADALAPRLGVESEALYELLLEREHETTTAIAPWLAIPHVVLEGDGKFDLLVARCRDGIYFSNAAKRVTTVFVIAGTKDERNFHLRALAAIAQIAQEQEFERRWLAARDEEALRDLVLLGKRRR